MIVIHQALYLGLPVLSLILAAYLEDRIKVFRFNPHSGPSHDPSSIPKGELDTEDYFLFLLLDHTLNIGFQGLLDLNDSAVLSP